MFQRRMLSRLAQCSACLLLLSVSTGKVFGLVPNRDLGHASGPVLQSFICEL